MISLQDLVTLAKAGYTPKAVKELVEIFQTVPEVKEAEVKETEGTVEIKKEPEVAPVENPPAEPQDEIATLIGLLKEEN